VKPETLYEGKKIKAMRICYVLLSPTFGMHQYTADLANRMVKAGHDVHLVTTSHYPGDRYLPGVRVHTPVDSRNTGFSVEALRLAGSRDALDEIGALFPDLVHITGPHAWNVSLLWLLRQTNIPVVHTLHDLDPHSGTPYGRLLHIWNRQIIRRADHILVHGVRYREQLLDMGVSPQRVTATPLLHLFLGQAWLGGVEHLTTRVRYEPWALFFGRMEHYKGVDYLITASAMLNGPQAEGPRLVLAGPGSMDKLWAGSLPPRIEVRNRLVDDDEAMDLFRRCGLLVLPYLDATQSALIPAAYFFRKPVVVTWTGALPEYVQEGRTGWLVEPDHPPSLARCLESALSEPARLAEMGTAGRAWYDNRRAAEQRVLEHMYQRLAEEKKRDNG
jgi:glycosyltransferase involved in cell wall biosynthesis